MHLRSATSEALRWSLGGRFFTQIISWAVTLVVIRILSPADYGVMAMVISVIGLAEFVTDGGLTAVIVNRPDMTEDEIGAIISFSGLITLGLFAAIFLAAPFVSAFYGADITNILRVAALVLPFRALGRVRDAVLVQSFNFRTRAFIDTASVVVQSAITLGAALLGAGVWALVLGALAGAGARAAGLMLASSDTVRPNFRLGLVMPFLRYSGAVLAQRILFWITAQIDIVLLSRAVGPAQLGIYATAKELATLPQSKVAASLNQITFAAFSAVKDDQENVRAALKKSLALLATVVFPLFFAISAFAAEIQRYILGPKWEGVAPVLAIWALIPPFRMINGHLFELLNGLGRADEPAKNVGLGLVALVPVLWVGLYWDILGAAAAYLAVTPLLTLVLLVRIKGLGVATFSDLVRPVAPSLLISFATWLAVMILRPALEGYFASAEATSCSLLAIGGLFYLAMGLSFSREQMWSVLAYVHWRGGRISR
jgi:O-antigen/teichoic acid export membrane protein